MLLDATSCVRAFSPQARGGWLTAALLVIASSSCSNQSAGTPSGGASGLGGAAGALTLGGAAGGGALGFAGTNEGGGAMPASGGTSGGSFAGSAAAAGANSSGGASGSAGGQTATGGAAAAGGTATTGGAGGVYKPPFILGADITITREDEHWGATYTDAGQPKSIEQLLKDHGFNFIRIDTFVNPDAAGGYAASMPEPFRDLAHTVTLAKRVKSIGLGFLLDLHYADTWTNPGAQKPPTAWANLALPVLETRVYDYTKDAVTKLKAASAMPDIVQIGNEITNGMLWDVGRASGSNFDSLATLLKAGIRAVREVDPAIQILLHIEKCNNLTTSQWWLDGVLGAGVAFDILGQSCYATAPNGVTGYQGSPAEWQATFAALATKYPNLKFIIAEYSAQQRAANDTMFNLPNHRGLGTFNWDPTRAYDTHPNHPLFTTNGAWNRFVAIPELMALYEKMAADYGLR
jgi:arabinogalactan endo-1,4-beta-galactosidase